LEITIGSTVYPFKVARDKSHVPLWKVDRSPDVMGYTTGVEDMERRYASTHSGFGWGQYSAPNTYHYGVNYDGRFPNQGICGPLVTSVAQTSKNATVGVTSFFEYGSYLYTLSGRYCNRIDPSADTVAAAGGFPYDFGASTVATMGIRFDANVLIAFTGTTELVKFDGTNFTSDADSLQGDYFAKAWSDTDWVLAQTFLSGSNPSVAWCAQAAEPFTIGNWSGADGSYPIGDSGSAITGIAGVERTIFVGKTDGLYYIDGRSGRAPLLVPAMPVASDNGTNMIADSMGQVWYPARSGLYLYDPNNGTIDDVSPGRGLADRSGIIGLKTAIAHYRAWTFVAVYDGTDSYIMAGRRREEGEPGFGPYVWHGALAKITSTKVTSMHLSSLVSPPRLWLGLLSGNVAYIKLPSNGDNPLLDSTYRYAASGSIYYPADDYSVGGMRWNLQRAVIEAEGLSATTTVQVYERRDLGSWVSLQTITSSGRTTITTTGDKRFSRCELRLDVVNDSSSSTPVIRMLVGQASRRPTLQDVIFTTVLTTDDAVSRMGIGTRYTGKNLSDQLDTLDAYYPVSVKDWWTGSERSQTVLVMPVRKRIVEQEGDAAGGQAVDLVMKVIA